MPLQGMRFWTHGRQRGQAKRRLLILAGMAAMIQPALGVPVIDSVEAGVRYALGDRAVQVRASGRFDFAWHKLSPELMALGVRV